MTFSKYLEGVFTIDILNKISLSSYNKFNWLNMKNIPDIKKINSNYYGNENIKILQKNKENIYQTIYIRVLIVLDYHPY